MKMTEPAGPEFIVWRDKWLLRTEKSLTLILDRLEKDQPDEVQNLIGTMRYALLGGGKRLRPLLALAGAEAVGGRIDEALPAACAVEMVHTYSLIHDDLPAMDDDDIRRGRPTCHKAFGEAAAILAGDALLTLAFETIAAGADKQPEKAVRAVRAAGVLARAAGAVGMVGGQALDLSFENCGHIQVAQVQDMELRKTGELIAGAIVAGATLAGGKPAQLNKLRAIALNTGLAFQIRDDLLNQSGDAGALGKAVGSDAARGKASFPAVAGTKVAEETLRQLANQARESAMVFRDNGRHLAALIDLMVDRQK